ncbi:phosphotransferase [Undibacterium flavidum]|uniref:Phosphotransferase n=1 Tax=Undibacterium flavidum TaxID=2762297 RepID=A0ABR6Y6W7_9BURK|nr:phosphotransferase [Undibacterium flavidum]MBC3872353.1 phosphotransferase [Undibacterium flavidum]
MFLTAANLAHYLTARAYIQVSDIVDGQFSVVEAGQNNRNFKVRWGSHHGCFIKQVKSLEELRRTSIRREATCYRWAQQFPDWARLIPAVIDYDAARYTLILELLPHSQNLREYYYQQTTFSESIAVSLAQALSAFHMIELDPQPSLPLNNQELPAFTKKVPWIFTYHKKSYFDPAHLSGGAEQLGVVVRGLPQLQLDLARLFEIWRFEEIIHADIKWDNCLVYPDQGALQLKIIDWEVVDIGDARWDVGSVFQAYLSYWIMRHYRDLKQQRQQMVDETKQNMPQMFSSIQAFWNSYCLARNIADVDRSTYLTVCLEFAAVRILQTAFESLHFCSEMSPHAYALLDMSQQVLRDPRRAAVELFGFAEDAL